LFDSTANYTSCNLIKNKSQLRYFLDTMLQDAPELITVERLPHTFLKPMMKKSS